MDATARREAPTGPARPPSSADLVAWCDALTLPAPSLDDAARLERIHRLEQAKAAIAAAQAVEVAAFVRSRRAAVLAEVASVPRPGVGKRRRIAEAERGIVADVAAARRESPGQARQYLRFAETAPTELATSFRLLARGAISERKLSALHRATLWLQPEQRQQVDKEVAPKLGGWGDRQVVTEAAAAGYRIDPRGACDRAALAAADRCVSLRPAPETTTRLSASLPLPQGVAVWAALDRAARTARAAGDPRTRGQVMADTLVERVTGQASAPAVPVAIQLVMTDQTLLGQGTGADEPARLVGGVGWLPAPLARGLALDPLLPGSTVGSNAAGNAASTVRRVFTDPAGHLVTAETTSRLFTPAMAEFIRMRDDVCRTPWCDAPIRHLDHIDPAANGGPTSLESGRGLCEHCNLAAQASGSVSRTVRDTSGRHTVVGLTPLRQVLRSHPPDPPGSGSSRPSHRATVIDLVWPPDDDDEDEAA